MRYNMKPDDYLFPSFAVASQRAREYTAQYGSLVRMVRNTNGNGFYLWDQTLNENILFREPDYTRNIKKFVPTANPRPDLERISVGGRPDPVPLAGRNLDDAIAIIDWAVTDLNQIYTMEFRSDNQTYTEYARSASQKYRQPIEHYLHGQIGDDSLEQDLFNVVDRYGWIHLQKSKSSVKGEIGIVLTSLLSIQKRLAVLKSEGFETHCGLIYSTTGKKHRSRKSVWKLLRTLENETKVYARM